MRLRILLIAPDHPDLPSVAAEAAAIASQHEAELLQGEVRDLDIVRAVVDGPYDIIWWATHGSAAGLLLSDGWIAPPAIVQYTISAGAGLCVLNTCSSLEPAMAIIDAAGVDVICTLAEIDDASAQRTGMLFSAALGRGLDYRSAYEEARPRAGDRTYLYLQSRAMQRQPHSQRSNASQGAEGGEDSQTLHAIESKLDVLSRIVQGDPQTRSPGLQDVVASLGDLVRGLDRRTTLQFWAFLAGQIVIVALQILWFMRLGG